MAQQQRGRRESRGDAHDIAPHPPGAAADDLAAGLGGGENVIDDGGAHGLARLQRPMCGTVRHVTRMRVDAPSWWGMSRVGDAGPRLEPRFSRFSQSRLKYLRRWA